MPLASFKVPIPVQNQGQLKSRLCIRKRPTVKRAEVQHPVRTDCWYEIVQQTSELARQGKVLVVTDIDGTLIARQGRGAKERFRPMPNAAGAVSWLQEADNIDVIALTARALQHHDKAKTELDLSSAGIQLLPEGMEPLLTHEQSTSLSRKYKQARFQNNIIYVSGQDKSKALDSFLSVKPDIYSHIIFIDDRIENCEYVLRRIKAGRGSAYLYSKPRRSRCRHHLHEWPAPCQTDSSSLSVSLEPSPAPNDTEQELPIASEQQPEFHLMDIFWHCNIL